MDPAPKPTQTLAILTLRLCSVCVWTVQEDGSDGDATAAWLDGAGELIMAKVAAGVRWEAEAESRIMTLDLDLDLVNPEQRRGHVGWRVPDATTTHQRLH